MKLIPPLSIRPTCSKGDTNLAVKDGLCLYHLYEREGLLGDKS